MLLEIFLFILVGILARVLTISGGVSPERVDFVRDRINYFVFYFLIPFICFKTTYSIPFRTEHLKISLVANMTILSSLIVSLLVYKLITKKMDVKPEVMGSLIMCASFGNVLYIGLPILTKLYGQEGISYALTYDFLASTPLTWTLAVAVCMRYGKARSFNLRDSILTILKIPPIWGLILGLIARELEIKPPEEMMLSINYLSTYIPPLMLIIVGVSIKPINPKKFLLSLPAILIKVFISPIFALIFGKLAGLSGITLNVCIIEAAMPSMLLSMIFATSFGVDLRTAVEMIFLTTVISLLNVSIFIDFFL